MNLVCPSASMSVPTTFNAEQDADAIHNALAKKGEEPVLTGILGHRTAQMRLAIRRAYVDKYQQDLLNVISSSSKLPADYQELLMCLMIGPIGSLARELRRKLDKDSIDEVICTAANWELREIQAAYEALPMVDEFKKDTKNTTLEAAIAAKVKDVHQRDYLLRLLKCQRPEVPLDQIRHQIETVGNCDALVDTMQVEQDVQELFEAGEPPKGSKLNEDKFVNIISSRSNIHLKKIYDRFVQLHSVTLVDFISKKLKSDVKSSLNTSIMAATDYKLLLIAQLYSCMSGLGTRETTLNRIICLRCEHDMSVLKMLYEERINKDLGDAVHSETSGEYRNLLMTLLNCPVKK